MYPNELATIELKTSAEKTGAYAALGHDFNPIHIDPEFAARTAFGQPIAHGAMALCLLMNSIHHTFGDAPVEVDLDVRFIAPVTLGQTIAAGGSRDGERYRVSVRRDDGTEVVAGSLRIGAAE